MERMPGAVKRGCVERIAAALLFILPASAHAGSSLSSAAKTFGKAAAKAGIARVCVSPFSPEAGLEAAEGRRAAEQLATELVIQGRVSVVERSRMDALMSERYLSQTGAVAPAAADALAGAEAVVTGTFIPVGSKVEIDARLVLLATGEVVAACRITLRREIYPELLAAIPEPAPISAGAAVADAYEEQTGRALRSSRPATAFKTQEALQDALADPCAGASEKIDRWQASVLELKARYWAEKAGRKGLARPGSVISDPDLRLEFYELLKEAALKGARPLTSGEVRRFVEADRRSFELHAACGL
ncbi:MAG TPA: hypothetical protein DCM05_05580 [Elusimicrobia bacterium]|nr:hypothetical protein [Elusimicrobiota bacterium]